VKSRESGVHSQSYDDAERAQIICAAREVLGRSGWWGFKVESVLRQAHVSTRSFYRHFGKKTDLLLALFEVETGAAAANLCRVTASAGTPSNRVRAYVTAAIDTAYQDEYARPSSLFGTLWRELLPEYPEAIGRCITALIAPLIEAVEDGAANGDFSSPDPIADAWAIFYLVSSIAVDQATLGGATPRETIEQITFPFISRAIGLK